MADSIFAASSTTPASSSERISSEFMAQGRPTNPATVAEGECLGGFEVRTPKVGDGFVEWAIKGYDLDGRTKTNPGTDTYDKHGDWLFDKSTVNVSPTASGVNDDNYSTKGK